MSFVDVLDGLMAAPGAQAAAFLDPQGETIAEVGTATAVETLGAYESVWLAELGRVAERSGLGELKDLALEFEGGRFFSANVKDGYFLLVLFDATGVVSAARARLDEVREKLAAEIG